MSAFSNRTQMIFSFSSVGGAPVYACGFMDKLHTKDWQSADRRFLMSNHEQKVAVLLQTNPDLAWTFPISDPAAGLVN